MIFFVSLFGILILIYVLITPVPYELIGLSQYNLTLSAFFRFYRDFRHLQGDFLNSVGENCHNFSPDNGNTAKFSGNMQN